MSHLNVVIKRVNKDGEENMVNDWAMENSNIKMSEKRIWTSKGNWEEMNSEGGEKWSTGSNIAHRQSNMKTEHWPLDLAMWKSLETLVRAVSVVWCGQKFDYNKFKWKKNGENVCTTLFIYFEEKVAKKWNDTLWR